uniref:Red chlorophyll catabolite reductase, chloroplastic n=2 Tax=Noccaea caerulescens TaxID=107243 RepID=A0A1J3C750_NOCCA
MEFPYVSATRRQLMVDLVSMVEDHLQSLLQPCSLPPDVRNFKNPNGSAEASLHIRSGEKSSPIDFVIGSWIHCKIPTGASLNITTISTFLNSSTRAPNFTFEVIQSSPTSLVIILDLLPRKDLVLHPEYIKEFYQDTALESHRQSLLKVPGIKPYVSPSLFVRSGFSPAVSVLKLDVEEEERLEEIMRDHVSPAAKDVLMVWLERCAREEDEKRVMGEEEKRELERRDKSFRKKNVEDDLELKFPRMFGEEVSSRVVHAIKEAFGVL